MAEMKTFFLMSLPNDTYQKPRTKKINMQCYVIILRKVYMMAIPNIIDVTFFMQKQIYIF